MLAMRVWGIGIMLWRRKKNESHMSAAFRGSPDTSQTAWVYVFVICHAGVTTDRPSPLLWFCVCTVRLFMLIMN